MRAFAHLLDRLAFTPSRSGKSTLIGDYLAATPDPDRGWALAALTGTLKFDRAKPSFIRKAVEMRMDGTLFKLSYDYVGDLAETVALVWPTVGRANREPQLSEIVERLRSASRREVPQLLERWLDALDVDGRWALLKLLTGGLRVGVSARLAKQALAEMGSVDIAEIEEIWHSQRPPYEDLLAWLEGRGEKPTSAAPGRFRPMMLAQAIDPPDDFTRYAAQDFAAEWKWDGIRVQAVSERGHRALFTRSGEDISRTFPDIVSALTSDAVLDGELLIKRDGRLGTFSALQQRLNRRNVDGNLLDEFPAAIRAYDLLVDGDEDIRGLAFASRRKRLDAFIARATSPRIDVSPLLPFESWAALASLRERPPEGDASLAEGLMLKRWDSRYEAGRPRGLWFKWKRDPHLVDAVLLYAQRGHGKRSGLYSDFTFGVWRNDISGDSTLTPVGKAYFGFTDEELVQLDKFVRDNTVERFGPVSAVRADREFGLVLEVAFEGLQRSPRHKSGVAMRFPRIHRIRWDKPAREADDLESLEKLLG